MNLHEFLIPPAESARRKGPHDRIVMSSRVRLARNIRNAAFPGWAKKPERVRVLDMIRPAIEPAGNEGGIFRVHGQSVRAGQTNPGRTPSYQSRARREEFGQRPRVESRRIPLRDDQRGGPSADAGVASGPAIEAGVDGD